MDVKRIGSQPSQRARRVADDGHDALAIQEALDGKPVEWLEKVTDEQYQGRT